MIAGDPGLGKSMMTASIASIVTTGSSWPCTDEEHEPGNVIMLSAEDGPEDTIVPRLTAAGANLDRVTFFEGLNVHDEEGERTEWVSLDRHMNHLDEVLQDRKPRLLVVDPISAFLGKTDSHNNSAVRAVLGSLGTVLTKHRTAGLVVSHLNKGNGGKAMYRVTGSLAFTAAARAVYYVTRDPEDDDLRLLLPLKNNLAKDQEGFRYVVKEDDNGIPFIEWDSERESRSIDDILEEPTPRQAAKNERDQEVVEWLKERLEHGPVPATAMWDEAKAKGFSEREVKRCKKLAEVRPEIIGYQGDWHWRL